MQRKKPIAPRGQRDSLSALVASVESLFDQSKKARKCVPTPAAPAPSLDALEGEKCQLCAKPFEATRITQIFCSAACRWRAQNAAVGEARAEARAAISCVDCGRPGIAIDRHRRLCNACRLRRKRELEGSGPTGWRAAARAALACVSCGSDLAGARRKDAKLCPACRLEAKRAARRRYKARAGAIYKRHKLVATVDEKKAENGAKGGGIAGNGRVKKVGTVTSRHRANSPKPTVTEKLAADLGVDRKTATRRITKAAKDAGMPDVTLEKATPEQLDKIADHIESRPDPRKAAAKKAAEIVKV